ncbi:DUF1902 domain-containing protein [Xanthomonas campestris]|uniref:DUF1902 domain-containing protein n=1 Tax=Xanthomonas cannabis TaxID=1885674 RepID=UPI001E369BE0|nr:DUF1902 domain-containing protein [Xanthomonas campestris pv. zinniae]
MSIPNIKIIEDTEAGVFIATSPDHPGLVVEAGSMDELMEEIRIVMADLDNTPTYGGSDEH